MKQSSYKNKTSVTVGICTSFAGNNLLTTAKSIKKSAKGLHVSLVIYADNTPISPSLRSAIEDCGFVIHWTRGPGSFLKKARKLIAATKTDILVLTQDDILFDENAIRSIVLDFETYPGCTMLGIRVLPLVPQTPFEQATASMVRIVDRISSMWNRGDNYLAASGRCLAFRTEVIRTIDIPEVVNGDMYLYLANRAAGGVFFRSDNASVYIRAPQTFEDQIGPSSRFQYSRGEMEQIFLTDLSRVYRVPVVYIVQSFVGEFIRHPLAAQQYLTVFIQTRFRKKAARDIMRTVWNADSTTKHISV